MDDKKMDIRGRNGAEALKKWHSEHPEGSRCTHGVKSVHIRRRYSDARTREGKQLRGILRDLEADLGDLSAGQRLLLDSVRSKLIVLLQISKFADKQVSLISPEGELLPCLGKNYGSYADGLRRDIETLYSAASRRPSRVMDLETYLRAKKVDAE